MQIDAKGLSYSYDLKSRFKSDALREVSLTINEGEFFGIIGKTGSGKSTFVQHLNALIKVQKNSGTVIVGDFDLSQKKIDYKALRSKIGMVFQYPEYQLFAETVFDDVKFALDNFKPEMAQEEKQNLVQKAIEAVGLNFNEVKDKSPFELSGGQKRRVAIAGAIVSMPEVLILDEPVAGLDPKGKEDFLTLLHKLHSKFVKTIVIITHDMDIASEHCSSLAVFSDGKILKKGTPQEVFSDEELLLQAGLELPLTAYLQKQLKNNGVIIDSNLTVDDFIAKCLSYKKEGK